MSILGRPPDLELHFPVVVSAEVQSIRKTKSLTDLWIHFPTPASKNSKASSLLSLVCRELSSPIAKPSYFASLRGKKAKLIV